MSAVEPQPQQTEYVILESNGDGWREAPPTVTARDANQAIRQHLDGLPEVDSQFVAVPARSWRPVKVTSRVALDFGSES